MCSSEDKQVVSTSSVCILFDSSDLPYQARRRVDEEVWEPKLLGEGISEASDALAALAPAISRIQVAVIPADLSSGLEVSDAVRAHLVSLLESTRRLLDHISDSVGCVAAFTNFMQQDSGMSQADGLTMPVDIHVLLMANKLDAMDAMWDTSSLVKTWDKGLPMLLYALRSAPDTGWSCPSRYFN